VKPYRIQAEMFWRPDPEIEAMKERPCWAEFHREAGKRGFYCDFPTKEGRRYKCVAFTTQRTATGGWTALYLAEGEGKTALDAMDQAYRNTGRADEVLDRLWSQVMGDEVATPVEEIASPVAADDDFDALFEGEPEAATSDDEFEDLFG